MDILHPRKMTTEPGMVPWSVWEETAKMTDEDKIKIALLIAFRFGSIDGDHHKMWAIDQIVRALTGDTYDAWVKTFENGEDGPKTYEWNVGIPP